MALISKDLAFQHCKAEAGAEDELMELYLAAAEQAAADYLNRTIYESQEALDLAVQDGVAGAEPIVVDAAIKAAILLTCGHLYNNREDVVIGVTAVALPNGAQALLRPKRRNMGP
ncbi:head-tail connector protein [Herbaspirillum seropedicae]|uniref:head-tail connector protein n=1 Tax=Herbaspirillum seropedicae TaxID=964 RepID=UPI0028554CDB|nr:head-tail connector protein [Herbaspirillum seropedicae]MDR6394634.1 hypothetical protein [Herbaspirillum seropedicae]